MLQWQTLNTVTLKHLVCKCGIWFLFMNDSGVFFEYHTYSTITGITFTWYLHYYRMTMTHNNNNKCEEWCRENVNEKTKQW